MIRIIGNHVSPYARKVFLALDHKGIDYEIDPIVPFFGGDEFTRLNPLRRIPVLIDGDLVIPDSTVISNISTTAIRRNRSIRPIPPNAPGRAGSRNSPTAGWAT